MSLFRRAVRLLLGVTGFVLGLSVTLSVIVSRWLIAPPRQRQWATPADIGLAFEEVSFPARDGARLSGWFIPGQSEAVARPTIILLHGWGWNRLGSSPNNWLARLYHSTPVDFLRLVCELQHAGYNVLMLDLRNHGESAASPPVTFGLYEADDLLGALATLSERDDVDQERIGVIGFSMGANALLYALPHTEQVRAGVAVQPASGSVFARRYGYTLLGPLAALVLPLAQQIYLARGGIPFNAIEPTFAASAAGDTPILYIQGEGDPAGSVRNVAQMAAVTPQSAALEPVQSESRRAGYQMVVDEPGLVLAFFREHLGEEGDSSSGSYGE